MVVMYYSMLLCSFFFFHIASSAGAGAGAGSRPVAVEWTGKGTQEEAAGPPPVKNISKTKHILYYHIYHVFKCIYVFILKL